MPPRKTGTTKGSKKTSAPKDSTAKAKRVPPVGMMSARIAPHPKTLANGQPRPKSRRSK